MKKKRKRREEKRIKMDSLTTENIANSYCKHNFDHKRREDERR